MKRFDKLVRDRIPELIAAQGRTPQVERVCGPSLVAYLRRKLVEEAREAARADDLLEELADVYEVVRALLREAGLDWPELEDRAAQKRAARGGFRAGTVLKAVGPARGEP